MSAGNGADADSDRIDAHKADLSDPNTARALAIQTSEESHAALVSASRTETSLKHHREETVKHHREVMTALAKLSSASRTILDEQAEHSRLLIELEAWKIVTVRDVQPRLEQEIRRVAAESKATREAQKRERMQIKDLKEDVEEVTDRHEASEKYRLEALAKRAAELEAAEKARIAVELAERKERIRYYVRWGLVALLGIALFVAGKLWR